jgi:predicted Zn-dependent protease with MMP-like domain
VADVPLARAALDRAAAALPHHDPHLDWWRAETLLANWELESARRAWAVVARRERTGDAYARLALAEDACGRTLAADRAHELAHEAEPESFPLPARLADADFDAVVEGALDELRARYPHYLDNVVVVREPMPFLELIDPDDPGATPPDLLGLFVGPTTHELAEDWGAELPPSIYLFQRNLERIARDRDELAKEIRTTLFHEVGHLLGLDEDEVEALGLG